MEQGTERAATHRGQIAAGEHRAIRKEVLPVSLSLEPYRELFEKLPIAHVATASPDGRPQVTPVWIELHEGRIRFSTTKGRVKHRYLVENPNIALSITAPNNPYEWVQVRGKATITDDPDGRLIQKLSHDYHGRPFPPEPPEHQRIIVTVEAERMSGSLDG